MLYILIFCVLFRRKMVRYLRLCSAYMSMTYAYLNLGLSREEVSFVPEADRRSLTSDNTISTRPRTEVGGHINPRSFSLSLGPTP